MNICSKALLSGLGLLGLHADMIAVTNQKTALKVGWVSQAVVAESKEGQELEKTITEEHKRLTQEVDKVQKMYTTAATDFNTKSAALSAQAREVEGEKVAKLKRDYEEALQKSERTLQRKVQEATQEAYQSFALAAQEYAKKHNFDVLFSESGVVYVSDAVNTKDEMKNIMNSQYEVKLAQNKAGSKPAAAIKTTAAPKAPVKKDAKA